MEYMTRIFVEIVAASFCLLPRNRYLLDYYILPIQRQSYWRLEFSTFEERRSAFQKLVKEYKNTRCAFLGREAHRALPIYCSNFLSRLR